MKIVIVVVVVLVAGIAGLIMIMRSDSAPTTSSTQQQTLQKKKPAEQPIVAIQSAVRAGARLLDVRTPEEYAVGHIEGSTNMPLVGMQSGSLPDAPKDTKIYVYCRSGNRSAQAKTLLGGAGFTKVVDLGGMNDVVAMGGKQVN